LVISPDLWTIPAFISFLRAYAADITLLFDRADDTKVLSAGFTQQIYGPFRLGVQASLNLDTGELYNTDFTLNIAAAPTVSPCYNPDLAFPSLGLVISTGLAVAMHFLTLKLSQSWVGAPVND